MTDDIWEDLLRSPLDGDPDDVERGVSSQVWVPVAAALAGMAIGFAWLAAGNGAEPPQATTTTAAASVGAESEGQSLPPDYVRISIDGEPVEGALGLRPEVVYTQRGDLYVTLSSAVRAELEPDRVAVFAGGDWTLDFGGSAVPFSGEITNPQSLGLLTVRFEGAGGRAEESGVLRLRPVGETSTADVVESLTFNGLPARIDEPLIVELDEGTRLVVDGIEMGSEGGTLVWHLEAVPSVRAQVDAVIEFPETIDGEEGQVALVIEHWDDPYPFQRPPKPTPTPSWGASEVLRRAGPDLEDPTAMTRGTLLLTVNWQQSSIDRVIEIPLAATGS